MTEESIEHMASVVEAKGTDAFWQAPIEELLPASLHGEAPRLEKRLETMDVWFDSGTSWAGCVETTKGLSFPADLYLEASTSLMSCAGVASSFPGASVINQRSRCCSLTLAVGHHQQDARLTLVLSRQDYPAWCDTTLSQQCG